ncbi:ATP-binding protein [Methanoregula sp.]|uniref:ATP-binding protein n=1 Tax=Methanoregula sp. TaxID=2052170 RepID=UPI0026324F3A|nr:ATP-binding protein [Methanoregula sp.]MDD5143811.1 ATP-binding protein [Methanoregula sp.]
MSERPAVLSIRSDINEIPRVSDLIESVMQGHQFPDEDILDTQLAVEEVVTNVIMHGYGEAGGEILVSLSYHEDESAMEIRVEDSAEPFDPLSLPEPDISLGIDDRKIGGLGIFLTRQVMDDIQYRYEDNKNVLILKKKRSG